MAMGGAFIVLCAALWAGYALLLSFFVMKLGRGVSGIQIRAAWRDT